MLKHGIRHSNIELQCACRRTNVVEEKGENNKSVTESFKLASLRSYKHFYIELQCPCRRTKVVEEKGENNKSVTESVKLALLRSYEHF